MSPVTQFASQRIVQGAPATLTATFVDQDGEARIPGAVTVHVVRSDGSDMLPAGTVAAVDGAGLASVPLTSAQTAALEVLTCVWTEAVTAAMTTTVVEVIGGHYFSLLEARITDRTLQDLGKFPDEDLKRVRDEVEREVYRITGRAFTPHYRTDQTDAGSVRTASARPLNLAEIDVRTIRWVKINGATYASTYWELTSSGRLYFGSGIGLLPNQVGNGPWRGDLPVIVTTGYEYGWPSPPDDLKRAMIARLRSRLVADNTNIPARATATTDANGNTYSLSTPGQRGARIGIPEIDEVYDSYTRSDWKEDFVGSLRVV